MKLVEGKRIYSMSEAGYCPRLLAAPRLGYELLPESEAQKRLMRHASKHEKLFAEELGLALEGEGERCDACRQLYGIERSGIHVELPAFLFTLIGHLDRIAVIDGKGYPVEIKALGRFSFEKFRSKRFEEFPEYAGQEVCYLESLKSPGLYIVGNRDTGEILKYTIPYNNQQISLPDYTELELPLSFKDIVDKLNLVEIHVREEELPEGIYNEKSEQCRYCRAKYLCLKREAIEVEQPELLEAAEMWKEGKKLEEEAEQKLEVAKNVFIAHAKQHNLQKFQIGRISVNFLGERTRRFLSEAKAKELLDKELLEQLYIASKPFLDIRIKIVDVK